MSEERLAEIRAALDSVPAGPWWWRMDCGSPDLMTQHSGWLYLLGSEAVVREDGEPQADIIVRTEYPDAEPPRAPLMRSSRELGDAFKANPVVRFTEQSPTLVADLLAEVDRLRAALKEERGSHAMTAVNTAGVYDDLLARFDEARRQLARFTCDKCGRVGEVREELVFRVCVDTAACERATPAAETDPAFALGSMHGGKDGSNWVVVGTLADGSPVLCDYTSTVDGRPDRGVELQTLRDVQAWPGLDDKTGEVAS